MLIAKCLRFKDRNALIEIPETGQIIEWPITQLPEEISIGSKFKLDLVTDNATAQKEIIAKQQMLQELIN